ncbi:hypothetical protein ACS0TY_023424 [Phlomoides rotata]
MTFDEEGRAQAEVWNYAYGFIKTRVVKTAVELEIPEALEKHGGAISLSDLSSAVSCPPEPLYRIMRFLIHHRIFKRAQPPPPSDGNLSPVYYAQTPLSRLLAGDRMAPFIRLHGTPPGPSGGLTVEALRTGKRPDLKSVNGEETWTDRELSHVKTFTDAMNAHARVTATAIIRNYAEALVGIGVLVDVGGRHGMAVSFFVEAFPWVRGIAFDLPDIVAKAPHRDGVEFVGGTMFEHVPQADVVMLMRVLHDWSDKACVRILKKCKEAVPPDTGKVMIVDAILEGEGEEYAGGRLLLDMVMMAVTVQGKERTYKEWTHLLKEAGFSRHTVKNIGTIESVIEAYP